MFDGHCKQVVRVCSRLFVKALPAAAITLAISACTSTPGSKSVEDINFRESSNAFLREAEALFAQQDCESALLFVDAALADPLTDADQISMARISAQCYAGNGDFALALQALNTPAIEKLYPQLPGDLQLEFALLRAGLMALLDQPVNSAREYIMAAPLELDETRRQQLFLTGWSVLAQAPKLMLEEAALNQDDPLLPWLELAMVARDTESGIDYQLQQVFLWQQRWQEHPISQQLPREFTELQNLAQIQPKSIALLLPLSGPLAQTGQAIRDGFVSALLQQLASTGTAPDLQIYDSASGDFLTLYENVSNSDAEFIIGPLEKNKVKLLFDQMILTKPTLALNKVDDYGAPAGNLYQFALNAEEEAEQLAVMARAEGHENVLIIGNSSVWSQRSIKAFKAKWQELGGEVRDEKLYEQSKNYSRNVEQLLGLNFSHKRARTLQDTIGKVMEYTPRRRQDVDAIVLFANPKEGRALKPLFAFHYAADLPVFSSSRIFDGNATSKRNRDLEGIYFLDMPWQLEPPGLRSTLLELSGSDYARLQAFGIDAFMVYPRLPLLSALPHARLPGQTGLLLLDQQRVVKRELEWAQFLQDNVRTLPRKKISEEILHDAYQQANKAKKQPPIAFQTTGS